MGMSGGKLVPKVLAGYRTGRRTMQDDDTPANSGPIPPAETGIVTLGGDYIVALDGKYLVTE